MAYTMVKLHIFACSVEKLYFNKVENLVAITVFNPMLRPLRQSYKVSSQ